MPNGRVEAYETGSIVLKKLQATVDEAVPVQVFGGRRSAG
jgi:hypothetical protein